MIALPWPFSDAEQRGFGQLTHSTAATNLCQRDKKKNPTTIFIVHNKHEGA